MTECLKMVSGAGTAFVFLLCLLAGTVRGQHTLEIEAVGHMEAQWQLLGRTKAFIADNDSLNEELVDLVRVFSVDSLLPSRSQRHRVAELGWVISMFGYKWKALRTAKQKFVGTERDHIRVPGNPPQFTEYDVNFNLIPHTRRYIDLVWVGYAGQKRRNRWKRIKDETKAPWTYPETLAHIDRYRMHCELTPPECFRSMLNEKFYPCIRPNSSKAHFNIGTDHATFGVYGPYVADFNHSGHPEIHPYDWIWWYDTHPDRLNTKDRTWFFGFMKEASNRFRGWYRKKQPRVGQISVPFMFDLRKDTLKVTLEHLVHDEFDADALESLQGIPENATDLNFETRTYTFTEEQLLQKRIIFRTSNPILQQGIVTWFSGLRWDMKDQRLYGYLNIGVSVRQLYNAKLSFE